MSDKNTAPDTTASTSGRELYEAWVSNGRHLRAPKWDDLPDSTRVHWNKQAIHVSAIREAAQTGAAQPVQTGEAVDENTILAAICEEAGYANLSMQRIREILAEHRASLAPVSAQQGAAKADPMGDKWHSLTCDGTCSPPCDAAKAPAAQAVTALDAEQLEPLLKHWFGIDGCKGLFNPKRLLAFANAAILAASPASTPEAAPTDAQIIAALHANGIDTYPSKYGFEAVQVSATSVPSLRNVLTTLAAATAGAAETSEDAQDNVRLVLDEVERATRKFPTWPTDPLHAVAVLGEEFGELTKAALQTAYEPHKVKEGELRTEAIQTAAMALRFVASLERYEFVQCDQHEQPTMRATQQEGGNG